MRTRYAFSDGEAVAPVAVAPVGPSRPTPVLSRPVEGLLFDMGDVLYDATLWRRWLLKVLRQLGLYTTYRAFFHLWDHDFLADVHRGRRDFCEAFEAFLRSAGLSPAQIDEVEAACEARRNHWEATARLLPGVKRTLDRLHAAGIPMGVSTDSEHPAAALNRQLDRLNVGGHFGVVVSSIDLERTKPDPACYLAALDALGLGPEQTAFVGHDTDELAGAAGVGMATIAFNYDADAQADVFVSHFDEIFSLVVPPT
jgi:HAD superfamily hydrolase (TIGR01509 family)